VFKKSVVVGVSVSPEMGLEIAQIDYATGTVLKYGRKSIDYNIVKREIVDIDLFKETLQDLLEEMAIPKGTELILNMPTVAFKTAEYPAALEQVQIESAIEEELYEDPYLRNFESCYSIALLNSTLQFNKIAYTALNKSSIIELILSIREMGYKIHTIDTSVNSVLHSLIYLNRVNTETDTNWLLLIIDNSCCRILSMQGRNYVDVFEEKISIGEVLSDAENYSTVINAVEPILRNLPAKYLCVVSKTNVISAEVISNKITYSAPIIYQEANCYLKEPLLNLSNLIDAEYTKSISLDVIGIAIYKQFAQISYVNFNLYNKTLGDIYLMEQPPTFMNGKVVLTNNFLFLIGIIITGIIALIMITVLSWFSIQQSNMNDEISNMEAEISRIDDFMKAHPELTGDVFDEGNEIRLGITHNKNIYSYYSIVGTEIPQKLWLTHLMLSNKATIEGQADNLESVYAFFRSIKDYNPSSDITLQKLTLATSEPKEINDNDNDIEIDANSILTTLDADFYEFRISNEAESVFNKDQTEKVSKNKKSKKSKSNTKKKSKKTKKSSDKNIPDLEVIKD